MYGYVGEADICQVKFTRKVSHYDYYAWLGDVCWSNWYRGIEQDTMSYYSYKAVVLCKGYYKVENIGYFVAVAWNNLTWLIEWLILNQQNCEPNAKWFRTKLMKFILSGLSVVNVLFVIISPGTWGREKNHIY